MKILRVFTILIIAALLAAPQSIASSSGQGQVYTRAIEATATGETTGSMEAIFIDHFFDNDPIAEVGFRLESISTTVVAHRAAVRAGGFDSGISQEVLHEGQATIQGREGRPSLHLWITPLDRQNAPLATISHFSCTNIHPPLSSSDSRLPSVNRSRPNVMAHTNDAANLESCVDAELRITGNVSMVLWEWDVDLNGERVRSGVDDSAPGTGVSTGTGAGSADELVVEARNATLTIPLTPETYRLYLSDVRLEAQNLHLTDVRGTLPGVLDPVEGQDVELVGSYAVSVESQGAQQPFVAFMAGQTAIATADGHFLSTVAPGAPGSPNKAALWAAAIVVVLGVVAVAWGVRPLHHERVNRRVGGDQGSIRAETHRERRGVGYWVLARLAHHARHRRLALFYARRAYALFSLLPEIRLMLATALSYRRRDDEALHHYLAALASLPVPRKLAQAALGAAASNVRLGNDEAALNYIWEAVQHAPDYVANHLGRPAFLVLGNHPRFKEIQRAAKQGQRHRVPHDTSHNADVA